MIVWTEYLKYRARLRGFELAQLEQILKYSTERYLDTESGRTIVVGRHDNRLIMIAYEEIDEEMRPVTVHAITRQQVRFRVQTGRFTYE